MIPKSVKISMYKIYTHKKSGVSYQTVFQSAKHKSEVDGVWLAQGVICYLRMGETEIFSCLESDFRSRFKRAGT